jgi:hypothetical protein
LALSAYKREETPGFRKHLLQVALTSILFWCIKIEMRTLLLPGFCKGADSSGAFKNPAGIDHKGNVSVPMIDIIDRLQNIAVVACSVQGQMDCSAKKEAGF